VSIAYRKVKGLLEEKDYVRQTSIRPKRDLWFKRISLRDNGLLTIKKGYAWDFASGAIDTNNIIESSLLHDAFCELIHNDLMSYHQWDAVAEEMRDLSRENGMSRLRSWWQCRVIKLAGPDVTVSRKIEYT
jgi:hypothetical protein